MRYANHARSVCPRIYRRPFAVKHAEELTRSPASRDFQSWGGHRRYPVEPLVRLAEAVYSHFAHPTLIPYQHKTSLIRRFHRNGLEKVKKKKKKKQKNDL